MISGKLYDNWWVPDLFVVSSITTVFKGSGVYIKSIINNLNLIIMMNINDYLPIKYT